MYGIHGCSEHVQRVQSTVGFYFYFILPPIAQLVRWAGRRSQGIVMLVLMLVLKGIRSRGVPCAFSAKTDFVDHAG